MGRTMGHPDRCMQALPSRHQMGNARLALTAVHVLRQVNPDVRVVDERVIRLGVSTTRHPGRFESVELASGQTVVVDGAHSLASAAALVGTLGDRFARALVTVIVGMFTGKESAEILGPLADTATYWIEVKPDHPRAMSVAELRLVIEGIGGYWTIERSVGQAIHHASRLP